MFLVWLSLGVRYILNVVTLNAVVRGILVLGSTGMMLAGVVSGGPVPGVSEVIKGEEPVDFARQILPILSDKCFLCHGPDAGSRMANLRLDVRAEAVAERNGRAAIVPGDSEASRLVARINHEAVPMPPKDSGKELSADEKVLLARWIDEGAEYSQHWAFERLPESVLVPEVGEEWARDPLDRFVFERMAGAGLSPSEPASHLRWLRRVTLDLTGLPPTEEEIGTFSDDPDYEGAVDRLLESPHFGERMAVDWLDAARYADSYGYQSDLLSPTWPYRDWVVKAFNDNLPYDEFLTWQIAGDLLPGAGREQVLATAFNRLHMQSNEGGSIPLEFRTKYASDRVETFGTAVLGLTIGCARCHDHKYDPISQKEYYEMFAYFNSINEWGTLLSSEIVPTPSLLLPTEEQEAKLAELRGAYQAKLDSYDAAVAAVNSGGSGVVGVPEPVVRVDFDEAGLVDKVEEGQFGAQRLGELAFGEGNSGKAPVFDGETGVVVRNLKSRERWDPFTWSFWVKDPGREEPVVLLHRTGGTDVGFCGFDLMLEDGFLTARVMRHWPGNALAIRSKTRIKPGSWTHLVWSWDGSGRVEGLRLSLNGRQVPVEVLADTIWKTINAYGDLGPSGGHWAFAQRFRELGFKGGQVDDVLYFDRVLSDLEAKSVYSGESVPSGEGDHRALVDPKVQAAIDEVRVAHREMAQFENQIREISVMGEAEIREPAYVLDRGDYDAPRTEENMVGRGVPAVFPELPDGAQDDRLGLAEWVTRDDHPLTSRVVVNRFWQKIFGRGLVTSPENFGLQGRYPSHPQLLDYLAREFVDSGWDTKALVKRIALSATYRQDSAVTGNRAEVDPENVFLSRGPSGRLSAEMLRDLALAGSGLLEERVGGSPVNPYQPAGIWRENNAFSPAFVQSKGADLYRRSLYTTWKRSAPAPNMKIFDATSREVCTVNRSSTNTPLQALVLLNDVQFVEAARVLATKLLREPGTDDSRIATAFLRMAGRAPTERELAILVRTLGEQVDVFSADEESAKLFVSQGDYTVDEGLPADRLAAMTVVVQLIMNSDAVVWKR